MTFSMRPGSIWLEVAGSGLTLGFGAAYAALTWQAGLGIHWTVVAGMGGGTTGFALSLLLQWLIHQRWARGKAYTTGLLPSGKIVLSTTTTSAASGTSVDGEIASVYESRLDSERRDRRLS